ncbi:MAG: hypothetical protein LBJ81_02575 [Puniceicoccales bacterium]|jgi:hypothetical protein|nr:hypothetical protein [Puniceicoccales bacterium]
MDGKNDIENVKRPEGGKIGSPNDFPFRTQQTSKAESFSALQEQIEKAKRQHNTVDDRVVADFLAKIEGKSTTREELAQAAAVAQRLAEHPEVLSPAAQSQLMEAPRAIANHRNADYALQEESKDIVLKAATAMPALSGEAQKKLIDRATLLAAANRDPDWRFEFLENVADSSNPDAIGGSLDGISDMAKDSLTNLLGKTADKFSAASAKNQASFQKAAVKIAKSMQFPQKFDADSFREALATVPENMRSEEYKAQLAALDQNPAAERNPAPEVPVAIVVPEEDLDTEPEPEIQPQPQNTAEENDAQLAALEENLALEKNPAPEIPVAIVVPEEDLDAEPEIQPQPQNTAEENDTQLAAMEKNLAAEKNPASEVPVAIVVPEEDLDAEPEPEVQPQPQNTAEENDAQLAALEKNLAAEKNLALDRNPALEIPVAIVVPEEDLDAEREPEVEPQPENSAENVPPQTILPVEGQLPYIILENARPKNPASQAEKLDEDAANQENILTAKAE